MTLVARKLRLTTTRELEAAEEIFAARTREADEMGGRIRDMEQAYPSLCGLPGPDEEDMPEGLRATYDKAVTRYDQLARFLMEYPTTLQQALLKQQETRNKAGELVSSLSVGIFIQRIISVAKKFVPGSQLGQFEAESAEVYAEFLRANPAAILSRAGAARADEYDEA